MDSYGSMMLLYIYWVSMFTTADVAAVLAMVGHQSRLHHIGLPQRAAAGYNRATDGTGESHAAWWFQSL